MPITQEQALSLIVAGEQLESALNSVTSRLRYLVDQPVDDLDTLRNQVNSALLQSYEEMSKLTPHLVLLGRWREHYNYRYKANISNRRKQRELRQTYNLPQPDPDYNYQPKPVISGTPVDIDIDDIDKELAESIGGVSIKQIEETALKLHAEGNLPQPEDLHKIIADDRVIAYVTDMYARGMFPPRNPTDSN
jgi:hypothetical protein